MNEAQLVLGVAVVFILYLMIISGGRDRKEKIDAAVERVKRANEPGYKPIRDSMRAYLEDGVITYRRDKNKDAQR